MRNQSRLFSIQQLLITNLILFALMLAIWTFALWHTGARLDYRADNDISFIALRLAPGAGISYQWSYRGSSVWFWTPRDNRLLWVSE